MTAIQLTKSQLTEEVVALETKISELETHAVLLQKQVTPATPLVQLGKSN